MSGSDPYGHLAEGQDGPVSGPPAANAEVARSPYDSVETAGQAPGVDDLAAEPPVEMPVVAAELPDPEPRQLSEARPSDPAPPPTVADQVQIFMVAPEPPHTHRGHDTTHRKRALLIVGVVVAALLLGWIVVRTISPGSVAAPTPAADVTPAADATPGSDPPGTVPTPQPSEPTASNPSADTNTPSAQPSPRREPGHIGEIRGARYFSEQVLSTRSVGSTYRVQAEVCLRELPQHDSGTAQVSIRAWSVLAGGDRIFASSRLSRYPKTDLLPGSCQQGEIGFATKGQPVTKIIYQNFVPEKVVVW